MNKTKLSQALQAVNDIHEYTKRGDEPLARSARKTLDELCWSSEGYPPVITRALQAKGLRHTAS